MKYLLIIILLCSGCTFYRVHEQTIIIATELCKTNKGITHITPDYYHDRVYCNNGAIFEVGIDSNFDPTYNRDKAIMEQYNKEKH